MKIGKQNQNNGNVTYRKITALFTSYYNDSKKLVLSLDISINNLFQCII